MKRLLMLKPYNCGSGDTKEGKIYEVVKDNLLVWIIVKDEVGEEDEDVHEYEYSDENVKKYSNLRQERWVTIKDESSEDCFEVDEEDDRFIIFENDNQLAHELIDRVEGLDKTIVNMATLFMK